MLENLDNALLHIRVIDDFLFKSLATNCLNFGDLLTLLALELKWNFIILEFGNQLFQLFFDLIWEDKVL